MNRELEGKRAFISGSSSGIGKSIALELAKVGEAVARDTLAAVGAADIVVNNAGLALRKDDRSPATRRCRVGQPQDVANTIYFLTSDLSAYVTGSVIHVDGGTMTGANLPRMGAPEP